MAGAGANRPTTPDPKLFQKSSWVGRVRKTSSSRWVFEFQLEYPTDGDWVAYMTSGKKDDVLAMAIKAQLNGWIKEWHEDGS